MSLNQSSAIESPKMRIWRTFSSDYIALGGLCVLSILILAALFAPLLVPQNPYDLAQLNILDARLPPGASSFDEKIYYLLGTDDQGRDIYSAIIYGMRISLGVGLVSTLGALITGTILGLTAAYLGKRVDSLVMRIVDIQLSFPAILIALILLAVFGQGLGKIIIALITVQWAYYARTVRSAALVEMGKDYKAGRQFAGSPRRRIRARRSRLGQHRRVGSAVPTLGVHTLLKTYHPAYW